jgi:hypothetical protein
MSTPKLASAASDFDFILGDWSVRHRRLKARLCSCQDWIEFDGTSSTRGILGGHGNVEDNLIAFPEGTFRAAAFRSFDAANGNWAIWWLDGRTPHQLDTPVVGQFESGVGRFLARDTLNSVPILVRFLWFPIAASSARWEQAFSADEGQNWETNWTMDFSRISS